MHTGTTVDNLYLLTYILHRIASDKFFEKTQYLSCFEGIFLGTKMFQNDMVKITKMSYVNGRLHWNVALAFGQYMNNFNFYAAAYELYKV